MIDHQIPSANELSRLINQELNDRVQAVEVVDWHEDHISLILVDCLRTVLRRTQAISRSLEYRKYTSECPEAPLYIEVEAYKATGGLEHQHGDIAIVVSDMDLNRAGTGFYEAKAEGPDGDYPAFNMRQLRRLSSATPQLSLLLYQRTERSVSDDEFFLSNRFDAPTAATSRLCVVGANIAKKYPDPHLIPDRPQTFWHHFVTRYLTGRDLDYSRDPLVTIRRWLKVTRRASPLVVSIRMSRTASMLGEPAQLAALSEIEPIPFQWPLVGGQTTIIPNNESVPEIPSTTLNPPWS